MIKRTIFAASLSFVPLVVHAETSVEEEPAGIAIEENSEVCGYTFYTDGDDQIALTGKIGRPCFDLKSGRDILGLDPESFPDGTDVYTGPGRDIVLLTNGPDTVESFDDMDEEIVLRGGDDTLNIQGVVAEGLAHPGRSDVTLVRTGSGHDKITFGLKGAGDVVRLRSPNIVVDTEGTGSLTSQMRCNRFLDTHTVDLSIPSSGKTKALHLFLQGCGLSLGRQSSNIELSQKGGRLNMSVRSPAYELEHGSATVNANVTDGSLLAASFETSAIDTVFSWQGYGVAAANFNFIDQDMGGDFNIETADRFYATADVSMGHAAIAATAGRLAELILLGSQHNSSSFDVTLSAPEVVVSWYPDAGEFPGIKTPEVFAYSARDGKKFAADDDVISALDRKYEREAALHAADSRRSEASAISKEARREARENAPDTTAPMRYEEVNENKQIEMLHSARSVRPVSKEMTSRIKNVDFEIYRSGNLGCFDLLMQDLDGKRPDVKVACEDSSATFDASHYEVIELESDGGNLRVEFNSPDGFRVDRLKILN